MAIQETVAFSDQQLEVDIKFYLREYDDYLLGKRKSLSSALMTKDQGPRLCSELLKVIFEKYMHWTPTQVRDNLDAQYIEALRIKPLVNRIPHPPEVNDKTEFYYIAWYIYPETINIKPPELVIKLYKDILDGKLAKYPKGYFDGNKGYVRARILLLAMIKEFLPNFENIEAVYAYFASEKGKQCINTYKLAVPLRELYDSPLDYLHDALSDSQKDWDLYEKYSKQVQSPKHSTHVSFDTYTTPISKSGQLPKRKRAKKVQKRKGEEKPQTSTPRVTNAASLRDDGLSECISGGELLTEAAQSPIAAELPAYVEV